MTLGAFEAPLTLAIEKVQPSGREPSRWGFGPALGMSTEGSVMYGGTVVTPDVRVPLIDWRVGLAATAVVGPKESAAFASFVVRP